MGGGGFRKAGGFNIDAQYPYDGQPPEEALMYKNTLSRDTRSLDISSYKIHKALSSAHPCLLGRMAASR